MNQLSPGQIKLAVLIVTYNTSQDVFLRTLQSLDQASAAGIHTHVYILDNHKKMLNKLTCKPKNVTYFINGQNIGFGAGINKLIKKFQILDKYSHVMLVNPDLHLGDGFFSKLIQSLQKVNLCETVLIPLILFDEKRYAIKLKEECFLSNSEFSLRNSVGANYEKIEIVAHDPYGRTITSECQKIGFLSISKKDFKCTSSADVVVVSTKESNRLEIIQTENDWFEVEVVNNYGSYIHGDWRCGDVDFGRLKFANAIFEDKSDTFWSGACAIFPKEFFKETGLFDENFFLYYEDSDLSLRGKENGFSTQLISELIAFHAYSHSANKNSLRKKHHQIRSAIMFSVKHSGYLSTSIAIFRQARLDSKRLSYLRSLVRATYRFLMLFLFAVNLNIERKNKVIGL